MDGETQKRRTQNLKSTDMKKQEQISQSQDRMPEVRGQKLPIGERKYQNKIDIETKFMHTYLITGNILVNNTVLLNQLGGYFINSKW